MSLDLNKDELARRPRWVAIVVGLVVALAVAAGLLTTSGGDEPSPTSTTVLVAPTTGTTPQITTSVDKDRSSGNEPDGPKVGAHEDAVDEFPEGVDRDEAEKGLQQTSPETGSLLKPVPPAGAQNYSCRYRPVVNQSGRAGQKILLFVLHFTVSPPGSMNTIWGLFNTRSFSASSTWLLEQSGSCLRLMANSAKPWTQGNFNGRSLSVEIIATGKETRAQWLAMPIIRDGILASLMRDNMKAEGLPLRLVNPDGCTVQQAGWTDHNRLECGNSHWDVGENFPFDVVQKQLVAGVDRKTYRESDYNLKILTPSERADAKRLLAERRVALRRGGWGKAGPTHVKAANRAKAALREDLAKLKRLGLTGRANRSTRYRVIQQVVAV